MLPKLTLPQMVKEDATPVGTISFVLSAAFDAHRDGMLDALLSQRPGALRWLVRHYLQPILGTAGDALPAQRPFSLALEWLLTWGITQIRPDRAPDLVIQDRQAWLERTSWRPAIALMCHYGFAQVPDFRDRYYRLPDESPAENLCGLWNIGHSTFYRYLDKGKRLVALVLHEQRLDHRHTQSLRAFTQQQAYEHLRLGNAQARKDWHHVQIESALKERDYLSALWHCRMAHEYQQSAQLIQRFISDLAGQPELDQHLAALHQSAPVPADEISLCLVEGELGRVRGNMPYEQECYERALRLAVEAHDDIALGLVYSRLGKYHEARDADRAFAYYQDSIELLGHALDMNASQAYASAQDEYAGTLVKLAWLYAMRNDPRAQTLLERADELRARRTMGVTTIALLEQAWGEYWRRAGKPELALEHKHRVLNLYERIGDREGVIKTYVNLSLVYIDLQQFDVASRYIHEVLNIGRTSSLAPEVLAGTYLNLGICNFWQKDFKQAIQSYLMALSTYQSSNLRLGVARAHHNLAETFYTCFTVSHDVNDEQAGNDHAAAAITAYSAEGNLHYVEMVRGLKQEILGGLEIDSTADRLLPAERAAHLAEISEVEKNRVILAAPEPPEKHIRAHLAIANAYLAISAKEREEAISLIHKHGLRNQFAGEFRQLRATYERELTHEQKLATAWKTSAGDLINDERRTAVIVHLIEHGSINKSDYAELCHVGLATASKHLAALTEHGLVQQVGKGPSTRYVLP